MTPQEKAKELYLKYWRIMDTLSVKQSLLIAVKEIIASGCTLPSNNTHYGCNEEATEYWNEVKNEINKL